MGNQVADAFSSVIRVCTNKSLMKNTSYKLHDHVLDVVDCNKYLGVNISEDLNWKKPVDYTAAKASRTLGFLRRNLRDCSKEVRSSAYNATQAKPFHTLSNCRLGTDLNKSTDFFSESHLYNAYQLLILKFFGVSEQIRHKPHLAVTEDG